MVRLASGASSCTRRRRGLVPYVHAHEIVVHLAGREERVLAARPAHTWVNPRRQRGVELEESCSC